MSKKKNLWLIDVDIPLQWTIIILKTYFCYYVFYFITLLLLIVDPNNVTWSMCDHLGLKISLGWLTASAISRKLVRLFFFFFSFHKSLKSERSDFSFNPDLWIGEHLCINKNRKRSEILEQKQKDHSNELSAAKTLYILCV